MVVRIRLQRFGRHDRPFYRIVAADARAKRDGRFLEMLGSYNPIASKDGIKEVRLQGDRIKYWLSVGAQPSARVSWLLSKYNILPVQPLRPSTVQHLPRKERKELAEAKAKGGAAAGGATKAYHTSSIASGGLDLITSVLSGGLVKGMPGIGSLGVGRLDLSWARRKL